MMYDIPKSSWTQGVESQWDTGAGYGWIRILDRQQRSVKVMAFIHVHDDSIRNGLIVQIR